MQLRGWGLTRASRIVIILLVVQHLGLSQVLAVTPVTSKGSDPADPSLTIAALDDALLPFAVLTGTGVRASATIGEPRSRTIPPDPVSLPRRCPRAPPAA
jgi:hypothetical protein